MAVTDRTLLTMGVITFLVTLGCFSTIVYNIGGFDGITGFAVSNQSLGYVNVSVKGIVAVSLVSDTVNFGSGVIGTTGTTDLYSNGTLGGSGFTNPGDFWLRNDGNVHVNVTINGSAPGTFYGNASAVSNYTYFADNNSEGDFGAVSGASAACANVSAAGDTNAFDYAYITEWQIDPTPRIVCPNMSYADAHDEFNVTIHLELAAADDLNGTFNDVLTFYAYSLGS